MLRTKRKVLQMNCLSSGDLKEEKNCSLIFNTTPNLHARQMSNPAVESCASTVLPPTARPHESAEKLWLRTAAPLSG